MKQRRLEEQQLLVRQRHLGEQRHLEEQQLLARQLHLAQQQHPAPQPRPALLVRYEGVTLQLINVYCKVLHEEAGKYGWGLFQQYVKMR